MQITATGASHALDHNDKSYLDEIMKITDGRGVDVILEMLSDVNLSNDLGILAKGGRVVVIGCRGTVTINPRNLMSRETSIIGMTVMSATPDEVVKIHSALIDGLKDGTLNPIVGHKFPLAKASKAHAFMNGRGFVRPEDVKAISFDVLRHRIIASYEAEAEGITGEDIVKRILDHVDVP